MCSLSNRVEELAVCNSNNRTFVGIQCMFCMQTHYCCLNCCRYDPDLNQWTEVASMNCRRKHLGTAVLDNLIYAVGGRDENTELNTVER